MPLYEYKCHGCGCRFERIERASEPKDGVCPDCGGPAARLIGSPALQFKGSGWYVNDYGKNNGSRATATESDSASASSETTTSTKTETKSDASNKSDTAKKSDPKVA